LRGMANVISALTQIFSSAQRLKVKWAPPIMRLR
jgi:hypothetical protein